MGYRATFTDYLDDVSGYYPGTAALSGDPLANYFSDRRLTKVPADTAGIQRGDLLKKDTYLFAVIGISYTFVSSWCPAFSDWGRSEEHTSELQSLMRSSYAVYCLQKTK